MFKIGEFSKLTQVSTRMLRYYDEMGLLKPAKIDSLTGYRMYSAEQISTLNRIIYLRDSGFNVAEIALSLDYSNNDIIEQLDKKSVEIMDNIQKEQEKLKKIEIAKKELLHGKSELYFNITIKEIPSYCVLSLRKEIPNYYYEGELWKELSAFAAALPYLGHSLCGPERRFRHGSLQLSGRAQLAGCTGADPHGDGV